MLRTTSMFTIKGFAILLTVHLMLISCAPTHENTDQAKQPTYSLPFTSKTDSLPELTPEQQSSFDALNTLQVNTDEKNRLYSTFANIVQPCYPPDTSIAISRSELLTAMEQFLTKHCTALTIEKRHELVSTAVLAEEEYTVLHCPDNLSDVNYENGLPMTGTWVMSSVLGRRDVVLVW
ncbi:MAG: hypothetical protein JJE25_06460 [Bacteroidia bacterium]|nr:hypothetical protein [Bacteroidia bacterium]